MVEIYTDGSAKRSAGRCARPARSLPERRPTMSIPIPQTYPLYVGVVFPGYAGPVVYRVIAWQPLDGPSNQLVPVVTDDDSSDPRARLLRLDATVYCYAHTSDQALCAAYMHATESSGREASCSHVRAPPRSWPLARPNTSCAPSPPLPTARTRPHIRTRASWITPG